MITEEREARPAHNTLSGTTVATTASIGAVAASPVGRNTAVADRHRQSSGVDRPSVEPAVIFGLHLALRHRRVVAQRSAAVLRPGGVALHQCDQRQKDVAMSGWECHRSHRRHHRRHHVRRSFSVASWVRNTAASQPLIIAAMRASASSISSPSTRLRACSTS